MRVYGLLVGGLWNKPSPYRVVCVRSASSRPDGRRLRLTRIASRRALDQPSEGGREEVRRGWVSTS